MRPANLQFLQSFWKIWSISAKVVKFVSDEDIDSTEIMGFHHGVLPIFERVARSKLLELAFSQWFVNVVTGSINHPLLRKVWPF